MLLNDSLGLMPLINECDCSIECHTHTHTCTKYYTHTITSCNE